ncbi:flagellar hook-length control protein FliK [Hyphomicrobiales bacterium 4NK60-0047b]|jgi:flagellar hook-length control protein FliK
MELKMTAEKITTSNALASISQSKKLAKTQELPSKQSHSADVFSKHLDQKLDNVDKNSAPIDRPERRQNELSTGKINDERQRNTSRQEAHLDNKHVEKKQQADKRLEEQRADEANEKKQSAKPQQTVESTEQFNSEELTFTDETSQNGETNNLSASEDAINTETTSDSSETANQITIETTETLQNSEELQTLVDAANTEENTSIENPAILDAASETTLNKTNADEKGLAANSTALANQQDSQTPTAKTGQPIDTTNAKTPPHLESTLGQDNDGQGGGNGEGQKGQSSENPAPFNKAKSDLFAPKEGTFSQNNQAQTNNAPILASTQLTDQFAKGQNIKTSGPEITQLISSDKAGDTSAAIGTNADVKQSSPATHLRAAGYTSPTQSVAIQIAAKAQNGAQQFEIRLNPPELGRVDVRLEFTKDGQVTTHLIVERPETLDMLSKDARQLEKALSDAGVDIESEGLTFSLQDQESQGSSSQEQNEQFSNNSQLENEAPATQIEPETIYRQLSTTSGLDMSV